MLTERPPRHVPRVSFAVCPAVPAAMWLCGGILFGVRLYCGEARGVAGVLILLFSGVLLALCQPLRLRLLGGLFPFGVVLALLHCHSPWQTYRRHLPRPACSASIRGVVVSPDPVPVDADAGVGRCERVEVQLEALRVQGAAGWVPCRGRVLTALPPGTVHDYGLLIEADGVLMPPAGPLVPSAFDYRRYLYLRGIRHVFHAASLRGFGSVRGWRRALGWVYGFRRFFGCHLVSGIASESHRTILIAMSLGYRQSLSAELRDRFLRSGAIHIFAISGLHVCIVWSLLFLVLKACRVPYRLRHGLVPPVLGCYVLLTGGSASAVRAWTMISVLSVSNARLQVHVPLNAVAASGLLLLFVNPLHLFQVGFLFSFTIVSVLVLGWPHVCALVSALHERRFWVPRSLRGRTGSVGARVIRAVGGASLAWFGSAGLVALRNGLLIPGALLLNVLLTVFAWWALALCGPKILFSWMGAGCLNAWAAEVFSWFLGGIETLVRVGSLHGSSLRVAKPPVGLVAVYYAGLICLLWPRIGRFWRGVYASCAACSFVLMLWVGRHSAPVIGVWYGGASGTPSLVVDSGGCRGAVVIDTGGPGGARQLVEWLEVRGCDRVDVYVASARGWGNLAGMPAILRAFPAGCVGLPYPRKGNNGPTAAETMHRERGGRVRFLIPTAAKSPSRALSSGGVRVTVTDLPGCTRRMHIRHEGDTKTFIEMTQTAGGSLVLRWKGRDGDRGTCTLLPCWHGAFRVLPPCRF